MERLLVSARAVPASHLVQVVLPVGVDQSFVYRVPPELEQLVRPGVQVEVPFRRRRLTAVVVERGGRTPRGRLRCIAAVPDPEVAITGEMLAFTRWLATYYGAPWGEVVRAALPGYLGRRRRARRASGGEEAEATAAGARAAAAAAGEPAAAGPPPLQLTSEQRAAVERIHQRLEQRAFGVVLLHGVTASGKTEVYMRAAERAVRDGGQALVLVPEISISVQLLDSFRQGFGDEVSIFHSDLPERQRRDAWQAVRSGRCRVLIGARSALFGPFERLRLVVVDEEHEAAYKQSEQPRYHARDAAVQRARLNQALAVLGSATPSLESTYNARRGRYELLRLEQRVDGRPLARIELADLRRVREGRRAELDAERRRRRAARQLERVEARLERIARLDGAPGTRAAGDARAAGAAAPAAVGAQAPAAAGAAAPAAAGAQAPAAVGAAPVPEPPEMDFIAPPLLAALDEVMGRGEQAILLVGRRGHSTFVQCTDCGQVSRCPDCEVSLVYHAHGEVVRCHHCGRSEAVATRCPLCEGTRFWYGGVGTQRVEAELHRRLPSARVLRMDLDTTRRSGAQRRIVRAFAAGEADVLLGTQMVAKGLHFPEVTLVGVVSADSQLNLPDFRAGERTFQLLTQVAGRAGRGRQPGRVIIQTLIPDHPAVQAACHQDYDLFYQQEVEERRELGYPPAGVMARFLVDGLYEEDVIGVADRVRDLVAALGSRSLTVLGPAPLPLARLRRRCRWHVTLLGAGRSAVHGVARRVLREVRLAGLPGRVRLNLDTDPVHLL